MKYLIEVSKKLSWSPKRETVKEVNPVQSKDSLTWKEKHPKRNESKDSLTWKETHPKRNETTFKHIKTYENHRDGVVTATDF